MKAANKAAMLAAALAAGLWSAAAGAQTQVTVYGIVDAAVARTDNVDAAGNSVTKVSSLSGSLPSRIGFRGSEDLGGGTSVIFALESGFNPDTGVSGQGGRLFGRQAWVGLKGKWGTLQVGRILNMTFLATAKSDVLGPNLFSINSIDLYLPNARSDNAVGYLGSFSGVTVGATYSLGRDASAAGGPSATNCGGEVAGNARACRQVTALLGYDTAAYGINATYDKLHGNTGAAGGLSSSDRFDRRITVNGYVMLGATKLGAGVIDRTLDAATGVVDSDLYYLGLSHPLAAGLTLDAQVARKDVKHSRDDTKMFVARLTYAFSKRSAVYGAVGRMDNHGAAAVALDAGGTVGAGRAQNGIMAGLRHMF
ncbi:porin [Massilia yuzhufengensis]|uniref:Outer membrane protein (Porin) n=1 Tax=Massilia yuzhufengensis TaxID=1164594 RepID=A0A1I1ERV3_9BURK|nr:porin [Massilia yuzhufengensis]SFB89376.1 Outer membrane protein (porin) [Massilia yuzhufengensis]